MSRSEIVDIFPLTPMQRGMLFHSLYEEGATAYVNQYAQELEGPLDSEALRLSYELLVERHASYRTGFVFDLADDPLQVVWDRVDLPFIYKDLSQLDEVAQQGYIEAHRAAERARGFDVSQPPLLRVALFRLSQSHHLLVTTEHHALHDGWSISLLDSELWHAYEWYRAGQAPQLQPARPYREFVAWLASQDNAAAEGFWRDYLAGLEEPTGLGVDRPTGDQVGYGDVHLDFHDPVSASLRHFCRTQAITLNTLVQGAFALLLGRYCGRDDVCFGVTSSGRPPQLAGVDEMVGLFLSTTPLRARIDEQATVAAWLKELQTGQLEARAHEHAGLAEIQSWSEVGSGGSLFEALLVYENYPDHGVDGAEMIRRRILPSIEETNYPLAVAVTETAEGLGFAIQYDRSRLTADQIERLFGHLERLLTDLAADPQRTLAEIELLTEKEREQLRAWNTGPALALPDACLHELFEAQVRERPQACALVAAGEELTYAELNARANRLAHQLRSLGVGRDKLVGIFLERNAAMVVAMLATLKAGGAYLPLDPAYPAERLAFMLEDAAAPVVVSSLALAERLPKSKAELLLLDDERLAAELAALPADDLGLASEPDDLAYVIYTSGSTGRPKGVMVEQYAAVNLVDFYIEMLDLTSADRVAQTAGASFDASVGEVWSTLSCGSELHIVDPKSTDLVGELGAHGITVTFLPTPLLNAMMSLDWSPATALRLLYIGGEAFTVPAGGHDLPFDLLNLYGPAETTVCCVIYRVPSAADWLEQSCDKQAVALRSPIGTPIANSRCYVLDEDLRPVPLGASGELYLAGAGLARGYLSRPNLTAEKFVPDPFAATPGQRMYRSGDLVRYLADGQLEFLGRIDSQVKIRGYRIELGEIESALSAHPAIREAVVVACDEEGLKRLVAYLVPTGQLPSVSELRAHLLASLPEYMLPAQFVELGELPLTANGKIDRKALPAPDGARPELGSRYLAPRSSREQLLAEIFAEVLRLEAVGVYDDFFELGGDSILSIQIVAKAAAAGLRLSPRQVFEARCVAALAELAADTSRVVAEQGPVSGEAPLTPIQHWFFEQQLPQPSHWNWGFLLETPPGSDQERLRAALQALVAHHDALRARFDAALSHQTQRFAPSDSAELLEVCDLRACEPARQEEAIATAIADLHTRLDLAAGPLLRAVYVRLPEGQPDRLLLVCHHLAIDGVSWRILCEDLAALLAGKPLPAKTSSFKSWAQHLAAYAQSQELAAELPHWLEVAQTPSLPSALLGDSPQGAAVETVELTLDAEQTQTLLRELPAVYHTEVNDLLLAALARTLCDWAGIGQVKIDLEGHGREDLFADLDTSRTVGWFTSIYPVVLSPATDAGATIKAVKEQLRAVPGRGLGYGALAYLARVEARAELSSGSQAEVVFNYLGRFQDEGRDTGGAGLRQLADVTSMPGPASHAISINGAVEGQELHFSLETRLGPQVTAQLAAAYRTELEELIAHCLSAQAGGFTPSDFPLAKLSQAEVEGLETAYPELCDVVPLSPMQQGMLFHSLYEEGATAYCNQFSEEIAGELDPEALREAFESLVERYPSYRTGFVFEGFAEPLQVVQRQAELPFHYEDLSALGPQAQADYLDDYFQAERAQGFEVARPPLLRVALFRLGPALYRLLRSEHHVLHDGWSMPILDSELWASYEAIRQGRTPELAPVRPYREFVAWLARQDQAAAESFWRGYLAGLEEPTGLGIDRPTGETAGYSEARATLDEPTSAALRRFCRSQGLTTNTLVQGAFALLLARYCGRDEVCLGVTSSGRPPQLAGVDEMVGLFLSTTPLRAHLDEQATVADWLSALQASQLEARSYEHAGLAQIQSWSELGSGRSLFEALLVYENYPERAAPETGLKQRMLVAIEETNYPLTLIVLESPEGLTFEAGYEHSRLSAEQITRLLAHLQQLLAELTADPQRTLAEIELLSEAERQQLRAWNTGPALALPDACLHELFEAQVRERPQACALVAAGEELTYAELNARANRLAHQLRSLGVGRDKLVGIFLERNAAMVVAMLATLKAGGAYLPLDPAYPAERLAFMLEDAEAPVVVSTLALAERLPKSTAELLLLDDELLAAELAALPADDLGLASEPDDLAYVIYTSGSTGRPKGVMIEQRAVVDLVDVYIKMFELTPADRMAQMASSSFDAHVGEIWPALSRGAAVSILDPRSSDLASDLGTHGITVTFLPTALVHLATSVPGWGSGSSLRSVHTAGEALVLPGDGHPFQFELLNLYGPTENTVCSLGYCVPSAEQQPDQSVADDQTIAWRPPIGAPIANARCYVLDEQLRPVPLGASGELYLAGAGLSRGYLSRPDLTAEKFVPDPFATTPGQRMYRSGDLVRYLADGQLEFLGRIDSQVKIRGYRIELGEIESALSTHPAIREAVVMARDDGAVKRLVAYLVPAGQLPSVSELRAHLLTSLPEYMLPAQFVELGELPLTANGKIDRKALPAPDGARPELGSRYLAPRSSREQLLAEIFAEVLRLEAVGVYDDFFELGGDSILSIQIVARAAAAGLRLSPRQVFEARCVAALAELAADTSRVVAEQGPVSGEAPLTPIQHWFFEQQLPQPSHWNWGFLLETPPGSDQERLRGALQALVAHHDALRARFDVAVSAQSQRFAPSESAELLEVCDLRACEPARQEEAIATAIADLHTRLDLAAGPLLRAVYVRLPDGQPDRLALVCHHLAIDGVSWRILCEDLAALLAGRALPAKTSSFKSWAQHLAAYAQSQELAAELPHWLEVAQTPSLPSALLGDSPQGAAVETVELTLDADQTQTLLRELPAVYHTEVNDLLLAALARTLCDWAGIGQVKIDLEGHGREDLFADLDLSRTVGWFTALFPVLLTPGQDPGETIKAVKEQLRAVPRHGLGYGLLAYLGSAETRAELAAAPPAAVVFNYLGRFEDEGRDTGGAGLRQLADVASMPSAGRQAIMINGAVEGQELHFSLETRLGPQVTAQLAAAYRTELEELIAHCLSAQAGGFTPSDFPLAKLSQAEVEGLETAYPELCDVVPLSPMQQGMLFHSLYEEGATAYCNQFSEEIAGELDPEALREAFESLVERYPSYRTGFVFEGFAEPLQVVQRQAELPFHYEDLSVLGPQAQADYLDDYFQAERAQGFEVARPPLLRVALFRLGPALYRLLRSEHHVLHDGWSMPILDSELWASYEAIRQGRTPELAPVRPYREFVAWLARQDQAAAESFWRGYLAGLEEPTGLGIDRPTGQAPGHEKLRETLEIARSDELRRFCRAQGITLNTLVQGAFALLIGRYTGTADLAIGVTSSGRPPQLAGVDEMVGLFLSTTPLRVRIDPEAGSAAWLAELQLGQLEARSYEHAGLAQIQSWSELGSGHSLFEALLVYENYPERAAPETGLKQRMLVAIEETNYPLTLAAAESPEGLMFEVEYERSRLSAPQARSLLGHLEGLLAELTADPQRRLSEIELLSEAERQQLRAWNTGPALALPDACLHELFEAQVRERPQACALVAAGEELTYAELNARANRLAHQLRSLGVGRDKLVGIFLERNAAMVVAMLATLKAGGAYLPLDPAYPTERIAFMLEDSATPVVVSSLALAERLPKSKAELLLLDDERLAAELAALPAEDLGLASEPDDLAYVIYTSGSTGTPKGVMIEHRAVASYLPAIGQIYGLVSEDRVLAVTSICFDLSVEEIFAPLVAGACCVLALDVAQGSVPALLDLIESQALTMALPMTTLWQALVTYLADGGATHAALSSLRRVVIGAEAVPAAALTRWRELSEEHISLVNGYGPTEATVTILVSDLTEPRPDGAIPIGAPIANSRCYVLDEQLRPVPLGASGELYLAGQSLARGYLGRPELTAEKFLPDPFATTPGQRMYRSGDLVRYLADGQLEFLGRIDSQVKIRGYRIELGEIESALSTHPAIREAVVMARDDESVKRLVAYLVPTGQLPSVSELRAHLLASLPEYMLPAQFVELAALPLTANGKIDRKALPAPDASRPELGSRYLAPRSSREALLAEIFAEVLRLEAVGVYDDFFELGGDSILSIQIVARAAAQGLRLSPRQVFEARCVAALAELAEEGTVRETSQFPADRLAPDLLERVQVLYPDAEDVFPLSPMQQGMLFHSLYEEGATAYCNQFSEEIAGELDPEALREAFESLVERYPSYRTGFVFEGFAEPLQVVQRQAELPFHYEDLSVLGPQAQADYLDDYFQAERAQGFEVARPPLLRVALFRLGPALYRLLRSEHHVLHDGWSMPILDSELWASYEAIRQGRTPELAPVRPYREFVAWLARQDQAAAESFWRGYLAGLEEPTGLGIDRPTGQAPGHEKLRETLEIARSDELRRFCRAQGITLNTLVQGAFALLIGRYTGTADLAIGVTSSGRPPQLAGVDEMVGLFLSTTPLRVRIDPEAGSAAWLAELQLGQLEARSYEHAGLAQIQSWSELGSGHSLFEALLVYENYPERAAPETGLEQRGLDAAGDTNYALTLVATESPEGLAFEVEYERSRLSAEQITRLLAHLQQLLAELTADPQRTLAEIELLSEAERQQLRAWNTGPALALPDACLHELFEAQVREHPQARALVAGGEELSYAELNARANRLAHQLRSLGVGRDKLVGIFLERNAAMVVAMLATLKAGGAYLPLDPAYPAERLAFMLEDAAAPVVVSSLALAERLPKSKAELLLLDDERLAAELAALPAEDLGLASDPSDLAYVIYTSGSTGRPKGVMIDHGNVWRLFASTSAWFDFASKDVWSMCHSFAFDFSVWEIWGALIYGGRLVIASDAVMRSPQAMAELIDIEGVSVLSQTPSAFSGLTAYGEANAWQPASLRLVVFGGEALEPPRVRSWLTWDGPALVNMYGITETTVHVTYRPLRLADCEASESPIGRPIPDLRCYVLDGELRQVPVGVAGELCVAGAGLARGYLSRPDLTAEKFLPDPFATTPGQRMYRSGDLVRYLADGQLEFLGRIDSQVKIRGYRIELGEIESALSTHPAIREAVVMARDDESVKRLVAYLVPTGQLPSVSELRAHLLASLPEYMLPAQFVELGELPLTANGKIDRKALPAPDGARPELGSRYLAPRSSREQLLAEIFAEVLRLQQVGVYDDFFELGGDSILSIQIVARAAAQGLRLSPRQVFEARCVAALAELAADTSRVVAEQGPVSGEAPLTPIQHWFFEQQLPQPSHWNWGFLLELPAGSDQERLRGALQELVAHHDALRARFGEAATKHLQWFAPSEGAELLRVYDLADLDAAAQDEAMKQAIARTHASLDIAAGPLLGAAFFQLGGARPDRLLLVCHHLAIDGFSWRIICEDLAALLAGKALPAKTSSFKSWAQRLAEYAQSQELAAELPHWLEVAQTPSLPSALLGDSPEAAAETVELTLDAGQTQTLLRELPAVYHTEVNDLLLASLARTLCSWGQTDCVKIDLEGHGREDLFADLDLSRTVGWFTALFPVLLTPGDGPGETIKAVKEQLRAVPRHGLGHGLLAYLGSAETRAELAAAPPASLVFNYLGRFEAAAADSQAPRQLADVTSMPGPASHAISINGAVEGQELHFSLETRLGPQVTAQLAAAYRTELEELIAHCLSAQAGGFTPSDFPLAKLSQAEVEGLETAYPELCDVVPLSPMQQGMLFHSLYEEGATAYCNQFSEEIAGELDPEALREAFESLVERYPSYRTGFVFEGFAEPLQVVQHQAELPFHYEDLSALGPQAQADYLDDYFQAERAQGFEVARPPLLRVALFRLGPALYRLLRSEHHVLHDGWSMPILDSELWASYEAIRQGRTPELAPVRPYREFVAWLARQDQAAAESFWRGYLAGLEEPTGLGIDRPTGETAGYSEARATLDEPTSAALRRFCRSQGLTTNTLVQGAFALLLARYCGRDEVCLGVTSSGRPPQLAGVDEMVGLFLSTTPLRAHLDEQATVADWLSALQASQLEARSYEHAGLAQIQSWSELGSGRSLFEALLVYENYPERAAPETGLKQRMLVAIEETNYPLTLIVLESPEGLTFEAGYEHSRLSAEQITRLLAHLQQLLAELTADPQRTLAEIELLSEAERQQLRAWNTGPALALPDACLHELFEAQVRERPQACALVAAGEELSYAELNARANRLAHQLRSLGVGRDKLVGIFLERNAAMVVAMLATLKAGGAYLPLDPAYPAERLAFMLEDAEAPVVVSTLALAERLPKSTAELLLLDDELLAAELAALPAEDLGLASDPSDLAYVIYTSGSTGRPKGVAMRRSASCNLLKWQLSLPRWRARRTAQFASSSFDVSFQEIFSTLCGGGTLIIVPEDVRFDPRALTAFIGEADIARLFVPNVVLQQLCEVHHEGLPPCLREVITAGEQLTVTEALYDAFSASDVQLVNQYGPTETHVISEYVCVGPSTTWPALPPIGAPIANSRCYVLDEQLRPVPLGASGELYLAGAGLARGYLGRPDLTAEKFVPDPFAATPGQRMYRSGDLVRYLADGQLEFLGRIDSQVKIRGYRIELGEIESALSTHPAIREAVVMARDDESVKRLVAYLVPTGQLPSVSELRAHLLASLPEYMLPAQFVELGELPLTANGKIDRKALPAPDGARPELGSRYLAPRSSREQLLAEIFAEVLRLQQVGVYDDFFELGGDSILSIRIVAKAAAAGLRLSPRQVFEARCVAALAELAADTSRVVAEQGPVSGEAPLTPIQRWFFDENTYKPGQLHSWLFLETPRIEEALLRAALSELVAHHDALRARFGEAATKHLQWFAPSEGAELLRVYDLADLDAAAQDEAMKQAIARTHASLDIAAGPLLGAAFFQLGGARPDRLLLVCHHLAIDGFSWRIICEDLAALLAGKALPAKTSSFKSWAQRLAEYAQSQELAAELPWWLAVAQTPPLPSALLGESQEGVAVEEIEFGLDAEQTAMLLRELPVVYQAEVNHVLLAAFARAFCSWAGVEKVRIDLEGHGREDLFADLDLSRTVGWFTALFPVVLTPGENPGETIKAVKEQLRALPQHGIGYGLLTYLGRAETRAELGKANEVDITLNYVGQEDQGEYPSLGTAVQDAHSLDTRPLPPRVGRRQLGVFVRIHAAAMKITLDGYARPDLEAIGELFRQALLSYVYGASEGRSMPSVVDEMDEDLGEFDPTVG